MTPRHNDCDSGASKDCAILRLDIYGNVADWSDGAERILGYTAEEVLGQPASLFLTEEDRLQNRFERELRTAADEGQAADENWLVRKDGRRLWASGMTAALQDGELRGFVKLFRDLTHTKAAEDALHEQGLRLSAALAAARMGTWHWDIIADRQSLDENLSRLVGLPPGESVGSLEDFLELVHPEDRPFVAEAFRRSVEEGAELRVEFRVVSGNGKIRWLRDQGDVVLDEGGRPASLTGACVDITERKAAEEAQRQSEERLRLLIESAKDYAIFTTDENRQVTSWNSGARTIFGYQEEEIVDRSGDLLFTPEDRAAGAPEDEQRRARELGRAEDERWHMRQDGSRFYASGVLTPLADGHSGCVKILRDLTERQAAEAALRDLNASLERRVAERTAELAESEARLRALALELTRTEQRERRRLSLVLHDHIQQLLVGAQMHLGIVAGETQDLGYKKTLAKGLEIIAEALRTCRSLAVELNPPLLHDQGLAAALLWLSGRMRENYRLSVEFSSDGAADPQGEDVRELLFQATRELLLNVVKHARAERARMRLTRIEGGMVQLDVEDWGDGFDPQARDVAERSRQSFGLFHIRERVRGVGGTLEVESAPGKGTRVRLTAPEGPPAIAEDPAGAPAAETTAGPAATGGRDRPIRVLLVDDHAIVREGLIAVLEREPGIAVIGEAADGQQAVEIARDLEPDVVLMDVSLPGVNGIAAAHHLSLTLPRVRIIGLSAHDEEAMGRAMEEAGAVTYLTKGGPAADLIAAIRAASDGFRDS